MWKESIQSTIDLIETSLCDEIEITTEPGYLIKLGVNEKLDEYRGLIQKSRTWLDTYRESLINETQIHTLKIKYTSASGYFIEIPKSQVSKIPKGFVHKQTLVNASRYITSELTKFESDIISAETNLLTLEAEILENLRQKILGQAGDIREAATQIGELDLVAGLSSVAYNNSYVCPEIRNSYSMDIVGGRHAVIETMGNDFISNDLYLDEKIFNHVITGPNMGGKSTFLRQNVLIILMAHIGSFVPAKRAVVPLTDKIFSRIGASDNLYLGQSTFMVEMQEIAYILNNATQKSFVIIDEVGRGTSTYDGMSLAWAILKENHNHIKAKTLFSTHYHELCEESKILPGVKNFSVAVGENEENIVFLRKIIPGAIYKSYGIEVAKLAGINRRVLSESRQMLEKLQNQDTKQLSLALPSIQQAQGVLKNTPVLDALESLDLDSLTPIEALVKLHELQDQL